MFITSLLSLEQRRADLLFCLLLAVLSSIQLAIICTTSLSLAPDEAHYWEWSRRLDYNYYSKGPIVALLIASSVELFGSTAIAVRLPALVCAVLFSILFYLFARSLIGAAGALLAWLLLRTSLFFSVLGMVMTTDPPLMLGWIALVMACHHAIRKGHNLSWIAGGIACTIAFLSKYTALILAPSILALLVFTPPLRVHLRKRGFLIGVAVFLGGLAMVVVWNQQHDWVTFAHNAKHVVPRQLFSLRYFGELLLGQFGLIGPILFPAILWAYYRGFTMWRSGDLTAGVLFCSGAPLGLVCLLLSITKRVYANWPAPLYISGVLLLTYVLLSERQPAMSLLRKLNLSIWLNVLIFVIGYGAILGLSYGLPAKRLPMKKLVGWSELGSHVERVLQKHSEDKQLFVLTTNCDVASEIAFYAGSHPEVHCANVGDRRMNQHDLWTDWKELSGRDALIVLKNDSESPVLKTHFTTLHGLNESLSIEFAGDKLREFHFLHGREFDGKRFPRPIKY